MNGRCKVAWGSVDWQAQDVEIAELVGCSRERVRQRRQEMGLKRSPKWHVRRGSSSARIDMMATDGMTAREVAKLAGCSRGWALQCLKRGKVWVHVARGSRAKYDWASADWSQTDAAVARQLGVGNPCIVTQYRIRKGIVRGKASSAAASKVSTRVAVGVM